MPFLPGFSFGSSRGSAFDPSYGSSPCPSPRASYPLSRNFPGVLLLALFCVGACFLLTGCPEEAKPDPRLTFFRREADFLSVERHKAWAEQNQKARQVVDNSFENAKTDDDKAHAEYQFTHFHQYVILSAHLLDLRGLMVYAASMHGGGDPAFVYGLYRRVLEEVFLPYARGMLDLTDYFKGYPGRPDMAAEERKRWEAIIAQGEESLAEITGYLETSGWEPSTTARGLKIDPVYLFRNTDRVQPDDKHVSELEPFTTGLLDRTIEANAAAREAFRRDLAHWVKSTPSSLVAQRAQDLLTTWEMTAFSMEFGAAVCRLALDVIWQSEDLGLNLYYWYYLGKVVGRADVSFYPRGILGMMGEDTLAWASPELAGLLPVLEEWQAQTKIFNDRSGVTSARVEHALREANFSFPK